MAGRTPFPVDPLPDAVRLDGEGVDMADRRLDRRGFRTCRAVLRLRLEERRPVHALFDGQLRLLPVGATVTPGRSRAQFLQIIKDPA